MTTPYREIDECRISGSTNLLSVLSLGEHYLTGVFPKARNQEPTKGPLELVWCVDSKLLQLRHSFDPTEMYGDGYGYRSSLNASMVNHLHHKARTLTARTGLTTGDVAVDIGSNDATFLQALPPGVRRIGVDPIGEGFEGEYAGMELVADFFGAAVVENHVGRTPARLITSIAMFYDLESPMEFVRDIERLLAPDGLWHFEQSYMPSMLRMNSYDTICHEHLEYYSFAVVKELVERCGLKVVDVETNDVNGGSFAVTAAKRSAPHVPNYPVIEWVLKRETALGLSTPRPFRKFEERVYEHRQALLDLVQTLVESGKTIIGYGASTKGNVLLQFCGITDELVPAIADVNERKIGRYTPGTKIPIVTETEARAMRPDYFLVLPWHFKPGILERESEFRRAGGKFIFPLPEIAIV